MKTDGDGGKKRPRRKLRPAPAKLEVVKRCAPLSLQEKTLYQSLVTELINEKRPANMRETALVEEIARSHIRLQRARRLETETLDKHLTEVQSRFPMPLESGKALAIVFLENGAQLESLQREEAKIEDTWYRVMTELDREQTARQTTQADSPAVADPITSRIHLVRRTEHGR